MTTIAARATRRFEADIQLRRESEKNDESSAIESDSELIGQTDQTDN